MVAFEIGVLIIIVVTLLMVVRVKNRKKDDEIIEDDYNNDVSPKTNIEVSPKTNIEIIDNKNHKVSYNVIAWLIVFLLIPICIGFYDMAIDIVSDLAILTPVFSVFIIYLICLAYKLGSIKKRYYMAVFYLYAYMFYIIVLAFVVITFPLRFLQTNYEINFLNSACVFIGNVILILTLYFVSIKDIDVFSSVFKFKKLYFERTDELKEFIRLKKVIERKKKSDKVKSKR